MSKAVRTFAEEQASVVRYRVLSVQVCVPACWTEEEIIRFAASKYAPCTDNGWFVAKQGDDCLDDTDARVLCAKRAGFVHVVLFA